MELILTVAVFLIILLVFTAGFVLLSGDKQNRPLHQAVEKYTALRETPDDVNLIYYRKFSEIRVLNDLLTVVPAVRRLDELMQQARVKMLAGVFILLSLTIGMVSLMLVWLASKQFWAAVLTGVIAMLLPYGDLLRRRSKQRAKFEALFPDALDLMTYSLKAGHSIFASFKMVAEEMGPPVGEEFGRVMEEINFGHNIEATLHNFARRVDSTELRYFVTTVLIQRETGGNLVEILAKISETIRKKFRFREKVRALTAEGKLSAYVLIALPFFIAMAMSVINRQFIAVLLTDPIGPFLLFGAGIMMVFGTLVILRLVQLDM